MVKEDRKLKIVFLPSSGWYPDEKNPYTALFVKEHAKAAALYHDVTIIYSDRSGKGTKGLYEIYSDKAEDGIRTIRIKHRECTIPNVIYRWSIVAAFKKLIKEGWKPDIIHAHVFLAGVTAAALKKRFGIPYVIAEHWTAFVSRTLSRKDFLKAQFAMNNAVLLLPVSKSLEDAIISHSIRSKQEVVPNVVDMNLFYPDHNQKKSEKKMLLCVATLSPKKGINYLLESIARLKLKRDDFMLDIIGEGKNRTELKRQASDLGLDRIVTFHGAKPKQEVAEFMRSCKFYVQPSLHETFGITYFEAMACGKPVVASRIPALQEKIDQSKGILVPPKDVYALTGGIDYMLDHYQDYSSENISQYVKDRFSHEKVGKQLDRIYRRIAE
jgi:glycosyltransferase involved in cell wall biosynthesis